MKFREIMELPALKTYKGEYVKDVLNYFHFFQPIGLFDLKKNTLITVDLVIDKAYEDDSFFRKRWIKIFNIRFNNEVICMLSLIKNDYEVLNYSIDNFSKQKIDKMVEYLYSLIRVPNFDMYISHPDLEFTKL